MHICAYIEKQECGTLKNENKTWTTRQDCTRHLSTKWKLHLFAVQRHHVIYRSTIIVNNSRDLGTHSSWNKSKIQLLRFNMCRPSYRLADWLTDWLAKIRGACLLLDQFSSFRSFAFYIDWQAILLSLVLSLSHVNSLNGVF